ncbi:GntR family transcriptional regulator [Salinicoccus albus]|uniref:GntR family transcriptional regulator n=1 Tax=Salinicoccus albus TaxID=418756 RepID=UPI00036529FA|nr:GntR family transcriptional regulator [Salinicoccus albus]
MSKPDFNISSESRIRNTIQEKILNRELAPGDKMPSENVIADEFKEKRIVVRNALVQLEKMGLLEGRQGIGRFVKARLPVIELDMTGRRSFSDKMAAQSLPYESRIIFARYATESEQKRYEQMIGTTGVALFKVGRLRIVNDVPCAIHISYIREDVVPDISYETDQLGSIFKYYNKKGITNLKSAGTQITTAFPTLSEQEYLECQELVPLIIYETQTIDIDSDRRLEHTRILYRSDLFKQQIDIH